MYDTSFTKLEQSFTQTPFEELNATTLGNSTTQPSNGLAKWFADKGNMNMLGAGITGLNTVAGLASMLTNMDTAKKQQKLLDQQLEYNRSLMNNRKSMINQLKGSY